MGASLVSWIVKNLPAMGETWVQSLGWEDPQPRDLASPERKEWLSTMDNFILREYLAMSGDIFECHIWGKICY